jgi:signal transduction histidine kinase
VVRVAVHQALDELREVIGVLREGDDDRPGDRPGERPQPALTDVPRLVAESRGAGTPVDVDDRVTDAAEVPAGLGRTAYRIVQEGLTNARRHGPGQPVRLVLDGRPGAGLTVEIRNPVPPASVTPTSVGTGTGLVGLAERVELAGGRLRHEVTPAGDFRLFASLPWPA